SHRQGELPDVFIFSTQRSGSTLLFDMVASQPGFKAVGEPFQERKQAAMAKYLPRQFSRFTELADPELLDGIERYISDLLSGRFVGGFERTYNWRNPRHHFHTVRNAVKVLRATHLLPWFTAKFSGRYILLVRHPVPTALSRTRNGWAAPLESFVQQRSWFSKLSSVQQKLVNSSSGESLFRRHIMVWCLEHTGLLAADDAFFASLSREVPLLHYETLVTEPDRILPMLAGQWEIPLPQEFYARFSVPSRSSGYSADATKNAIGEGNKGNLLARWTGQLSKEDAAFTQQALDAFTIPHYRADTVMPLFRNRE
ncbi:MAG: sulfotransferase, partial [Spirochaetaceae bacterium]|nr:sulfotransferase [Spirochaetaceae bacterium]